MRCLGPVDEPAWDVSGDSSRKVDLLRALGERRPINGWAHGMTGVNKDTQPSIGDHGWGL